MQTGGSRHPFASQHLVSEAEQAPQPIDAHWLGTPGTSVLEVTFDLPLVVESLDPLLYQVRFGGNRYSLETAGLYDSTHLRLDDLSIEDSDPGSDAAFYFGFAAGDLHDALGNRVTDFTQLIT